MKPHSCKISSFRSVTFTKNENQFLIRPDFRPNIQGVILEWYARNSATTGRRAVMVHEEDSPSVSRQFSAGGGVGVRGWGGGATGRFERTSFLARQPLKPLQSEGADERTVWMGTSLTESFGLNLLKVKSG